MLSCQKFRFPPPYFSAVAPSPAFPVGVFVLTGFFQLYSCAEDSTTQMQISLIKEW